MGTIDKQGAVTIQELLVSSLAQTDTLKAMIVSLSSVPGIIF